MIGRPSNLKTRRNVYAELPGVDVQPLYLSEGNLNAGRMLTMMGCDDIEVCTHWIANIDRADISVQHMPLYMHTALGILREMGSDGFDYKSKKRCDLLYPQLTTRSL